MFRCYRIILSIIISLAACFSFQASTLAATIGLSIPLSGDVAELGREFRTGANLAMEKYGSEHTLFIADDGCDTDLAKLAASDLAKQNPSIITGFLCNEAAIISANQLRDKNIPLLVAGARSVRLIKDRAREEWNLWRMSAGDDYGYKAAAKAIENLWTKTPYAIVDDGTIFGRTYTDGLRLVLNETEIKPQISDNFRAAQSTQAGLLRRLQRSGVRAAFIASATQEDLLTIAKNKQEFDVNIDFIMSEQLAALPFLEEAKEVPAGLMIVKTALPQNEELYSLKKLLESRNITPSNQIYAGYAAIQVAIEAIGENNQRTKRKLQTRLFQTITGSVKFSEEGANIINPYKLHYWDGEKFTLTDLSDTPIQ